MILHDAAPVSPTSSERAGPARPASPSGRRVHGRLGGIGDRVGAGWRALHLGPCLQRRGGGCHIRGQDDAGHRSLQLLRRDTVCPFRYT